MFQCLNDQSSCIIYDDDDDVGDDQRTKTNIYSTYSIGTYEQRFTISNHYID